MYFKINEDYYCKIQEIIELMDHLSRYEMRGSSGTRDLSYKYMQAYEHIHRNVNSIIQIMYNKEKHTLFTFPIEWRNKLIEGKYGNVQPSGPCIIDGFTLFEEQNNELETNKYGMTFAYLYAKVNSKSKFIRKCLKKIDTQEKQLNTNGTKQSELEEQIHQLKAINELLVAQLPQVYDYVAIKKRNSKLNREFLCMVKLFKRST